MAAYHGGRGLAGPFDVKCLHDPQFDRSYFMKIRYSSIIDG